MEMMEPQADVAAMVATIATATAAVESPKGKGVLLRKKKLSMLKNMLDDDDDSSSSDSDSERREKPQKLDNVVVKKAEEPEEKPRPQRRRSAVKRNEKDAAEETSTKKSKAKAKAQEKKEKAKPVQKKSETKETAAPVSAAKVVSVRLQVREALKESTSSTTTAVAATAVVVETEMEETATSSTVLPRKRVRKEPKERTTTTLAESNDVGGGAGEEGTTKPKRQRVTRKNSREELLKQAEPSTKTEMKATSNDRRSRRSGARATVEGSNVDLSGDVVVAVVATEEAASSSAHVAPSTKEQEPQDLVADKNEDGTTTKPLARKRPRPREETDKTQTGQVVASEKRVRVRSQQQRRTRTISSDASEPSDLEETPRDRHDEHGRKSITSHKHDEEEEQQRQRKRLKRPLSAASNGNGNKSSSLAALLDREGDGDNGGGRESHSRLKEGEKRRVKTNKEDQKPVRRDESKSTKTLATKTIESLGEFLKEQRRSHDIKPQAKKRDRALDKTATLDDYLKAKEEKPKPAPRAVQADDGDQDENQDAEHGNGEDDDHVVESRRNREVHRVSLTSLLSQEAESQASPTETNDSGAACANGKDLLTNGDELQKKTGSPSVSSKAPSPVLKGASATIEAAQVEKEKEEGEEEGVVAEPVSIAREDAVVVTAAVVDDASLAAADPLSFVIPKKRIIASAPTRDTRALSSNLSTGRSAAPAPQASPLSSVESTPVAIAGVAPKQRRSKNAVPARLAPLTHREKEFMRLTKKTNSFFKSASLSALPPSKGAKLQPRAVSAFGCTSDRYGVVLQQSSSSFFTEATTRMACPTRKQILAAKHASAFFGVEMEAPPFVVTSTPTEIKEEGTEDAQQQREEGEESKETQMQTQTLTPRAPIPCYETLEFERRDDRDWFQQLMYGTPFVPQLLRERTTLVMHNARYARKSAGMVFNSMRQKDDFCESLAQRFKMNRSVPRCDILPRNWQQLVNGQVSFVFLHFMNREDAHQARAQFRDDDGQPLTFKGESRRMAAAASGNGRGNGGGGGGGPGGHAMTPGRSPPPMVSPPQPPRQPQRRRSRSRSRNRSPRHDRHRNRGAWPPRERNLSLDNRDHEDRGRRPYDVGAPPSLRSPPARSRSPRHYGSHHEFASQSRDLERGGPLSQQNGEHHKQSGESVKGDAAANDDDKLQNLSQATTATQGSSLNEDGEVALSQNGRGQGGDRGQEPSHNGDARPRSRSRSRSRSRTHGASIHDARDHQQPRSRSPGSHGGFEGRSFPPRDRRGSREFYGRGRDNGRRGSFEREARDRPAQHPASQEWMDNRDRDHHGNGYGHGYGGERDHGRERFGAAGPSAHRDRHGDAHLHNGLQHHNDHTNDRPPGPLEERRGRQGSDDYRRPHDPHHRNDRGGYHY